VSHELHLRNYHNKIFRVLSELFLNVFVNHSLNNIHSFQVFFTTQNFGNGIKQQPMLFQIYSLCKDRGVEVVKITKE